MFWRIQVAWDMPWCLVVSVYIQFDTACALHFSGQSFLGTKAGRSSDTKVTDHQSTRRHVSEDFNIRQQICVILSLRNVIQYPTRIYADCTKYL